MILSEILHYKFEQLMVMLVFHLAHNAQKYLQQTCDRTEWHYKNLHMSILVSLKENAKLNLHLNLLLYQSLLLIRVLPEVFE